MNPTDPNTAVTAGLRSWLVGYDAVGRVSSFNQSGTTAATVNTAGFTYDTNGNRTTSTRVLGAVSTSRTYALGGNRMTGFSQTIGGVGTSAAYAYNANGDLTNDGLRSYAYDAEGRLAAATTGATDTSPTTRYAHNALGQRVFKTEPLYPKIPSGATSAGMLQTLAAFFTQLWSPATTPADVLGLGYVYDEQGTLIGEYGAGGAKSVGSKQYLYLPTAAGPMPVATIVNSETRYAVVADHLNTPRRITGSDGALTWQWSYSAFGEETPTVAARRFASVAAVDGDIEFNLRYPGQYFDKESNLHYNGFRTYNPVTGRYTQGDPIGLAGGWNRFGYVDASPLNFTDPRGLNPVAGAMAGASAGSAFGPVGTVVGGVVGAGVGAAIGWNVIGPMLAKPPENAYDPSGPKAPGKPGEAEGFKDPKGGENWVPNPNGRGSGWEGRDGGVWCPTGPDSGSTGDAHGGPHWDVEYPGGRYENVYPGGRRR